MLKLVATKFDRYVTGTVTFGFCLYDEYGQYYDNNMESKCEDDLDLLEWAIQNHSPKNCANDDISNALRDIQEEESDIEINGEVYTWDQIKHLF